MHQPESARDAPPDRTVLFMRMSPPWVFIDEIRRFVGSFCACACPAAARDEHLALAVHELVQNAVTCCDAAPVELSLEVDVPADRVSVQVSNACTAEEAAALKQRIDRMNREPDALRSYFLTMSESRAAERGGLGLARIRFESQLELAAFPGPGRVTVQAAGKLFLSTAHPGASHA